MTALEDRRAGFFCCRIKCPLLQIQVSRYTTGDERTAKSPFVVFKMCLLENKKRLSDCTLSH